MKSLAIIGAGPKALAVQAKLHALRSLGVPTPEVTVLDPHGIGGNWKPCGGWTDGRQLLGTSPDKDLGFPYRTRIAGELNEAVDRSMLGLSWVRFLTESDRYASWIDRGHPNPPHYLWASYLEWAAQKMGMRVVPATVRLLDVTTESSATSPTGTATGTASQPCRWRLTAEDTRGAEFTLEADSVLVTGPGRSDGKISDVPGVLSVAEFWDLKARGSLPEVPRVVVIGTGESAASVLDQLIHLNIEEALAVSPLATMFSRGESQFENELYTDPRKWVTLSEAARRDFIRRTDRGVLSVRVQQVLDSDDRVAHRCGVVRRVELASSPDADFRLRVHIDDEVCGSYTELCDLVIDARGGRPLWFCDVMTPQVRLLLERALGNQSDAALSSVPAWEASIGADLAVEGLVPHLFVPALAGMRQGPGFANLSCLGELSDRVVAGLGVGDGLGDNAADVQAGMRAGVQAGVRAEVRS
ncbi:MULTISPECIES: SidA/IucD/PvdA family monooxygenase [unclassified Corynebacterium]|uniref:SidA/IucD/PvdA family monooxygenase n=1 Tax=unclassified Corynebacterium TaxID=2624378 RepID=UPI001EF66617|nr:MULTISPECIES: SidA/IucD/PvdA family monooxygenase [unclassified Corynebacterium]MCG7262999.1 SidA/IucD/PvdA family monooxygenase [Corynebacterium sp. ACRQL]